ncbi:MAG: hypothetical protein NC177_17585 [Ruminococcus flavefaciens]|nr:hypothetical protein [Ruminococcus flavefaciens]
MNDKKIIMVDTNSINSYGQYKLQNHNAEYFRLKDGMEIIAYDDEDVWEAKVCYNPSAEYYEKWGIELGETIQILTEEERKWQWAGYANGKSNGQWFKEVEVAEKLIDYGMEIDDIQKILSICEYDLCLMKYKNLFIQLKEKIVSDGGTVGYKRYIDAEFPDNPVFSSCKDKVFRTFFNYFTKIESYDCSAWFLCRKDYENSENPDGFSWNEFEKISLESAESDGEKEKIKKWWECHLPVAMSVNGEYTFLAIDLENGSIVQGYEPDFEATETVAGNFEELIKMIIAGEFTWGNKDINYFRITVDETPENVISLISEKYDIKKYSTKAYFIAGNIAEIYINEDYNKDLTDSEDGWLYYNTNMDFFPTDKKITGLSEKELAENIKGFFDSMGLKSEIISEEH